MGTKKKNTYVDFELEWLENKAYELKQYIDDRPLNELKDRDFFKQTSKGGVVHMIAATVEQQRADLAKALKDYTEVIAAIAQLREQEAKREEMRKGFKDQNILDDE
jgi:hypothetical protein